MTVDPRVVINAEQARRFLVAVEAYSERGKRLKAFFALMYYAGLRPEEASELRRENLTRLPEEPGQWGEMQLTHSRPRSGSRWTDAELPGERSPLKHRPEGDTRRVPIHPELVTLLRDHLQSYVEDDPDSRVFVGRTDHRSDLPQGLPRGEEESLHTGRGRVTAHGRSLQPAPRGRVHLASDVR